MAHSTIEALKILPVLGLLLKAKHTFFPTDKHISFEIYRWKKVLVLWSMSPDMCNVVGKGPL